MTREEMNDKLKHLITCMKCEVSGKVCDDNCPTQYEAGNMGEIIENLEAISKVLEQEQKIGYWIKIPLTKAGQSYSHKCSECGRKILVINENLSEFPYCHCGAKMVEPQERSDKE